MDLLGEKGSFQGTDKRFLRGILLADMLCVYEEGVTCENGR